MTQQQRDAKVDPVAQAKQAAHEAFAQWRINNPRACPRERYKAQLRFLAPTWRIKTTP